MPNDNDSIDFNFFETEGDQIKVYRNASQSDSSKIVTEAVIETNPFTLFEFPTGKTEISSKNKNVCEEYKNSKNVEYLSSPTSSVEKEILGLEKTSLDKYLLNCLAYNDSYGHENYTSTLLDDKESSDSSLSDSTITTVTSDFTSVSPLTCISDSSLASDEFVGNTYFDGKNKHGEPSKNLKSQGLNEEEQVNEERQGFDSLETKESTGSRSQIGEKKIITKRPTISDNGDQIKGKKYNDRELGIVNTDVNYDGEYESESENNNTYGGTNSHVSVLEEELGDISLASQSSSKSNSLKIPLCRGTSKLRIRKKDFNMTFKRDELIKIERDNLILLKKIMSHSKPRSVSLNQSFSHKKTSAAINRARQQKKIEQDNYVLFNKISTIGRMKKVF